MSFTYENQGANTFLVYAIEECELLDSMSVGMITNNTIPGLVKAVFTQLDTKRFIKYNVSSKIPVRQLFSGPINKKRLFGVFHGILDAILSAEDYMIDQNMIVMDMDYMYADVSTCETTLICLPIIREIPQSVDLGTFFKHIMFTTQFDQTEDCDYVAKIINCLNSTSTFFPELFKGQLTEINAKTNSVPAVLGSPKHLSVDDANLGTPKMKKKQPQIQSAPVSVAVMAPPTPLVQPVSERADIPVTPESQPIQAQGTNKKMSLFYLLQHYNKENAEVYKAQKERNKAQKRGKTTTIPPTKKETGVKKQKPIPFAVPGQTGSSSTPFIPSAPVPQPMPVGSAALSEPTPQSMPVASTAPSAQSSPVYSVDGQNGQAPDAFDAFGGTVYFSEVDQTDSDTVLMGHGQSNRQIMPYLLRKHNNEKIPINKLIFRLGRDIEFNDYAIADNKFVGHSHCHIVSRDGEYYVVDDNSKNHTSINNIPITSGQEVKLTHGCILSVANEDFEFLLY